MILGFFLVYISYFFCHGETCPTGLLAWSFSGCTIQESHLLLMQMPLCTLGAVLKATAGTFYVFFLKIVPIIASCFYGRICLPIYSLSKLLLVLNYIVNFIVNQSHAELITWQAYRCTLSLKNFQLLNT